MVSQEVRSKSILIYSTERTMAYLRLHDPTVSHTPDR